MDRIESVLDNPLLRLIMTKKEIEDLIADFLHFSDSSDIYSKTEDK